MFIGDDQLKSFGSWVHSSNPQDSNASNAWRCPILIEITLFGGALRWLESIQTISTDRIFLDHLGSSWCVVQKRWTMWNDFYLSAISVSKLAVPAPAARSWRLRSHGWGMIKVRYNWSSGSSWKVSPTGFSLEWRVICAKKQARFRCKPHCWTTDMWFPTMSGMLECQTNMGDLEGTQRFHGWSSCHFGG